MPLVITFAPVDGGHHHVHGGHRGSSHGLRTAIRVVRSPRLWWHSPTTGHWPCHLRAVLRAAADALAPFLRPPHHCKPPWLCPPSEGSHRWAYLSPTSIFPTHHLQFAPSRLSCGRHILYRLPPCTCHLPFPTCRRNLRPPLCHAITNSPFPPMMARMTRWDGSTDVTDSSAPAHSRRRQGLACLIPSHGYRPTVVLCLGVRRR